jgi:hypothetical protein
LTGSMFRGDLELLLKVFIMVKARNNCHHRLYHWYFHIWYLVCQPYVCWVMSSTRISYAFQSCEAV